MCKRLLSIFSVAWFTLTLSAGPRSVEEAQQLAEDFFEKHTVKARGVVEPGPVALAATSADLTTGTRTVRQVSAPAYYVYNQSDNGFVIISGDDRMPAVLGYSFEGDFSLSDVPDNMRAWMQLYELKRDELDAAGAESWAQPVPTSDANMAPAVEPLLGDISYNQSDPYNRKCPLVDGQRSVTGCVATAMAQIMRYYKYPEKGSRVKSYKTTTHQLTVTYNFQRTTFDWDNMLPAYVSGQYSATEADAVAELMLACGVAASMDYSPSASGASSAVALVGMINYLGYNPYAYVARGQSYSLEAWTNLLKTELNASRPVLFSAFDNLSSGHTFVLDGYDEEGLFHVNWGWGGSSNGYYLVTRLQPGVTGIGGSNGSGYQFEQQMAVGLAPASDEFTAQSHFEMSKMEINAETQTVAVRFIYNYANEFSGRLALIAEADGVQRVISNNQILNELAINYGYSDMSFTLNVPPDLEDGTYDVYLASRLNTGRQWDKVAGEEGMSPEYTLVVEGGEARFVTDNDAVLLPEATLTPHNEELHSNRSELITMEIVNPRENHEFAGWMKIAVTDSTMRELTSKDIEYVRVGAGETYKVDCAVEMPEYVGKAYLRLFWNHTGQGTYLGEPLEVVVGEQGQRATAIRAVSCKLASSRVQTGENIVCTGAIGISSLGDYYDESIVAMLYRNGSSSAAAQTARIPVSLTKGERQDFTVELNAAVDPGPYTFRLYSYDATKSSPYTELWSSSVLVTVVVGISSVENDGGLKITAARGASSVSVESDKPLGRVRLYGAQGALLSEARCGSGDRTCCFDVAGLVPGTYIVQVTYADGTTQQVKFAR